MNRRDFNRFLLAIPTLKSSDLLSDPSDKKDVTIDLSAYSKALLPMEHGRLVDLKGYYGSYRYPSRDQSMQFMAFFNGVGGLYVQTMDENANLTDWTIKDNLLTISFIGEPVEVVTQKIGKHWHEAAEIYREWAKSQWWCKSKGANGFDFITTASYSSDSYNKRNLDIARSRGLHKLGGWLTQWRRFDFDKMYPDYFPRSYSEFKGTVDWARTNDITLFPFYNGVLVDYRFNLDLSPMAIVSLKPAKKTEHSYYACTSSEWKDYLIDKISGLDKLVGEPLGGAYIDLVAATKPRVCFSEHHNQEKGSASAWVAGNRALFNKLDKYVIAEGNAEVYLDVVDGFLMHLHTGRHDIVPLWKAVYGDKSNSYGWDMRSVKSKKSFLEQQGLIQTFGVKAWGSPWMTHRAEEKFLKLIPMQS